MVELSGCCGLFQRDIVGAISVGKGVIVIVGWNLPVLTNIKYRKRWMHETQRFFAKYEGLRSMAVSFD